jgi:hypothetical protein
MAPIRVVVEYVPADVLYLRVLRADKLLRGRADEREGEEKEKDDDAHAPNSHA